MLMEAKKHLKLIWSYFKFNLSAAIEYRVNFIIQTLGMMINNAAFIFFWWILFTNVVPSIGGYGFKDVALLWAFSSSAFGLAFIVFGNVKGISSIIVNGDLDSYLLQPKDVLINVISSKTIVSAWGDFCYGIVLYLIVEGFNLKLLLFLFLLITATLIFASTMVILHSLTFYIGNADSTAELTMQCIFNFAMYPEGIFNGLAKFIMYTVLPAGFITFIPLRLIQSFSFKTLFILLVVTALWIVLAFAVFKRGLKKYESGNLISNKI